MGGNGKGLPGEESQTTLRSELPLHLSESFNKATSKLIRISVALALLTTALFVTVLVNPFWFMATSTKVGPFHYGPFSFCREGDPVLECLPFKNDITYVRPDLSHVPADISTCVLLYWMEIIALVVNDGLLMWCAFKSPTPYWAKNSLECTVSGFIHGTLATVIFVAPNEIRNKKLKGYLGWSGYLVFAGLACQILTAIFIYLTILRHKRQVNESHELCTSLERVNIKVTEDSESPGKAAAEKRMRASEETEDNRGPELLKILNMYRQLNTRFSSFHYHPVHIDEDNPDIKCDPVTPALPHASDPRMSIEVKTFMDQLQTAAKKTEFSLIEPVGEVVNSEGTLIGIHIERHGDQVETEAETRQN